MSSNSYVNLKIATCLVRYADDRLIDQRFLRYAVNICTMAKENVGIGLVHPVVAYDFLSSQDIVFRRFEHDVVFHSLRIKPTIPPPSPQLQKFISLSESILKETLDLLEDHL
ncbi:hypothetical protein A8E41_13945 [Burkholderia cenocepacia]|uniref:hypothetical protein n=1 Tax=Burkholderia cenocepacia TaxID=95486 RepID=UPI0009814224|nr:hypothetical protein [Burkholderia cenocepacia]ONT39417.1 hypothetical protein A8E41_13945 [Burkholderia cenocepacia]